MTKRQRERKLENMHCTCGNGTVFACSCKKGQAVRYPLRQRTYLKAIYKSIYNIYIKFSRWQERGVDRVPTSPPSSDEVHEKPAWYLSGKRTRRPYLVRVLTSVFTALGFSSLYTGEFPKKHTRSSSSHSEESSRHSLRSSANRNAGLRRYTETVLLRPLTLIMNTFSPRCTTL
jgi:hypothetical protein